MNSGHALQTLHEALAAALLRDLPDLHEMTRDWEAGRAREAQIGAQAARAEFEQQGYPAKPLTRRPQEREVDVQLFNQLWGSTALGYGGLGGAAMTNAYTVVVSHAGNSCVYFGGGRLAYQVSAGQASAEQRELFHKHLAARQLASRRQAQALYGAHLPS